MKSNPVLRTLLLMFLTLSCILFLSAEDTRKSTLDSLSKMDSEVLARMGKEAYRTGDHERAIEIFSVLLLRYDGSGSADQLRLYAKSFFYQGSSLYEQGAYSRAMEALLMARRIAETQGWDDLRAEAFASIGNIYASNYDFPSAITFYRQALAMVEPLPSDSMRNLKASVLNNLTGAYSIMRNVDSARIFCRRFELIGDLADKRHPYDLLLTKALVEDAASNHDKALKLYRRTVRMADSLTLEPIYAAAVYSVMAGAFEEMERNDSAVFYMHKAADVALQEGYRNEHIASLRDLARLYDKLGDRQTSMLYKTRYLELADSLRLSEERDKLHASEMLYTLDTNASTIRGLNAIRTLQWRWLIALTVTLLIVIVLVVVLFHQKKALYAAWTNLYQRNLNQIKAEEAYRENIDELERKLTEAEEKIFEISNSQSDTESNPDATPKPKEQCEMRSLAMKEELKQALVEKIRDVMVHSDIFCQSDFSIAQLAAEVGSNSRYVSEVINDVMGKNFRELLNESRIKKAMQMLGDTDNYGHLTIKAIGESVGYKSSSTFISVFTRITGLKPSVYQKLSQDKNQ